MDYDRLQRSVNRDCGVARHDAGGGRIASATDNGVFIINAVRWRKDSERNGVVFWPGADFFSVNRSLNRQHTVIPAAVGIVWHSLLPSGDGSNFRRDDNTGYSIAV